MGENSEKNGLFTLYHYCQIIFILVISGFTAWNAYFANRQANLNNRPFIGITDVATTRIRLPGKTDTYANTNNILITFTLENTGNLPAKTVNVDVTGKIGNVILPRNESTLHEDTIIPPHVKFFNLANLSKDYLKEIVERGVPILFSIKISYSDFEGYKSQEYTTYYKLIPISKDPPNFISHLVGSKAWNKTIE
jgi:hypothetical protein